jgi:ABC-2 type transport system permease protein
MIRTIARKEWVDLTRDGRFRGAAVLVFLLAAVGLVSGALHLGTVRAEREQARRVTRAQWLEQGEKNPHSAAHYGVWAFKPESPLAAFDPGLEPYTGVAVYLEAHKQNPARYRPVADATAAARFGELSGAGVLQLLVPLLVILLTFSAFTAEREAGTLRLLLSTGVDRRRLVLGKALGVSLALALLLVPLLLVAAGVLLADPAARGMDTLARGAGLVLGHGLYLGGFVFLGLAVSAWAPSSRLALLVLLGLWMANGLLVPRLASEVARAWAPVPTAETYARQVAEDYEKGIDGHDPADQRVAALEKQVLARYGVASKEQLPVNFAGLALQEGEEYNNTVNDKHQGGLWATWRRQESVHRAFSLAAPLLAVRALSSGLAGTDLASHVHFSRQAEDYRRMLVKHMNLALAERSRTGDPGYKAGPELWREVPELRPTTPSWREAFSAQGPSLALLAGWFLLTAMLALRAGSRLSPV